MLTASADPAMTGNLIRSPQHPQPAVVVEDHTVTHCPGSCGAAFGAASLRHLLSVLPRQV